MLLQLLAAVMGLTRELKLVQAMINYIVNEATTILLLLHPAEPSQASFQMIIAFFRFGLAGAELGDGL